MSYKSSTTAVHGNSNPLQHLKRQEQHC